MSDSSSQRLIIPALGPLYRLLSPLAELLLRIVIGGFLIPHGLQKVFGFTGTAGWFGSIGLSPGWLFTAIALTIELGCGALILVGFLTRPAALIACIFLLVAAATAHIANGFFGVDGGFEYPVLWATGALFFAIRGAGPISVDRMIGREF
jgi:putative oxidoreductase